MTCAPLLRRPPRTLEKALADIAARAECYLRHGLTVEETAHALRLTPSTVRSALLVPYRRLMRMARPPCLPPATMRRFRF